MAITSQGVFELAHRDLMGKFNARFKLNGNYN